MQAGLLERCCEFRLARYRLSSTRAFRSSSVRELVVSRCKRCRLLCTFCCTSASLLRLRSGVRFTRSALSGSEIGRGSLLKLLLIAVSLRTERSFSEDSVSRARESADLKYESAVEALVATINAAGKAAMHSTFAAEDAAENRFLNLCVDLTITAC